MKSNLSAEEFDRIYSAYKDMLYRIAFTYLKNPQDVEDCLQEIFLKRFTCGRHFESSEHEKRWLIRVTINLAKDYLKCYWRRNRISTEEMLSFAEVQSWGYNESERELFEEVNALPEKQRIVIFLYYFEEYNIREIAEILGCSLSAVKMRLKKGKELLRVNLTTNL